MDFLEFLGRRLNVSASEASKKLELVLVNYHSSRKYTIRVLDPRPSVTAGRAEDSG